MIKKPVRVISMEKVLTYITCPMKLAFGEKDKRYSVQELYDMAGRESIKTLFSFLALEKNWTRAYSEASDKFNHVWLSNLDKLNEPFGKKVSFAQNYILNKAKSILDFRTDEIVAVNFPLEYTVTPTIKLTDHVDLLVINSVYAHSRKTFRAINFFNRLPFDNDRYLQMRAGFFRLAFQTNLTKSHYRDFTYELRPLSGKDTLLNCNPHYLNTIQTVIKNVVKAIEMEAWYATNNEHACKVCPYKQVCNLSELNKL